MNTKMYAYFGNNYFGVEDCRHIVIPKEAEYSQNAINTEIHNDLNTAEINLYRYHSDLLATENENRVAYFKEMLLSEKNTQIADANSDYIIGIAYELYNKDGALIKKSEVGVKSKFVKAVIIDDICEHNVMKYREGFVFDGRIDIDIPEIARYGIKNPYVQHPYSLKITKIAVYTTIGDKSFIKDIISDYNECDAVQGNSMTYFCHKPDDLSFNNFSSHFLTNAQVGTTIIDATVVSKVLDTEQEHVVIPVVEIPIDGLECAVKINCKVNLLIVNIEVFLDNFLRVYDEEDIQTILTQNAEISNETEDVIPPENTESDEEIVTPEDNESSIVTPDEPITGDDMIEEDAGVTE